MARKKISAEASDYGKGNYLLYYLDRGILEQMTGHYLESTVSFEKAKIEFDRLYTRSISQEAASWVLNDYSLPYRGSEYEYVLLNVFQALNYVQMGDLTEALVEARDMSSKFRVIADVEERTKLKRFEDNGGARLLMGSLYEASDDPEGLNDAWIAYRHALILYDAYYKGTYVPRILQRRLLSLSEYFQAPDLQSLRLRFADIPDQKQSGGMGAASVQLIYSVGYSPLKVPVAVPLPVDKEFITKVTFPKFIERVYRVKSARLMARARSGSLYAVATEMVVDVESIAQRDMKERTAFIVSKALLRPALKYVVERKQKENIEKKHGQTAAEVFGLVSNMYNLYSEQADLRSWQGLPAQISVARVELSPGAYHFWLEELDANGSVIGKKELGDREVLSGKTLFFVERADR